MSLPNLFASLPMPTALRPTAVLVRVLNAILNKEPWARERFAQYAGRTLSLRLGALHLPLSFNYDGTFVLMQTLGTADVQLTVPTERLPQFPALLAQSKPNNPEALLALVHIQGDAGLASAIAQVLTQLRFDPEAEIAHFTGDLVAVRLVAMLKQLMATGQRTASHAQANIAEFLGEESGLLVSTDYASLWQDRFVQLEQRLQSLEQRTAQLALAHPPTLHTSHTNDATS